MKKLLFLLLVFLFGSSVSSFKSDTTTSPKVYKTKYVVILVIDGPRYSETFGDSTFQNVPNMKNTLSKEGVLYSHFRNNGSTFTNAGHTAITTGYYQSISNAGEQLPKKPSIFQYFLKASGVPKTDAWIISSKGKLEILANTKDKHWWNEYTPMSYCGENGNSVCYTGDELTWEFIDTLYKNYPPKLSLINLLSVDVAAHQNDWYGYVDAIKYCDRKALALWELIQSNPMTKDQTTLFITNDHGRHLDGIKDGFISHGDGCEGCRHIMLLAMGPDFKENVTIDKPAEMIDISKTIGELLHFQVPTSNGRVLTELFN